MEAELEDEDEDVHVVGGVDGVVVSGYESECFTISKILRRNKLAKKNVSKGVFDTAYLPQCEFSYLQHLPPIPFSSEFLSWPVIDFF